MIFLVFRSACARETLGLDVHRDKMTLTMAICAKGDQIFGSIIAKRATRTNMVHLKLFRGTAILASPTIPFEDIVTKLVIGISVESKPRLSLPH